MMMFCLILLPFSSFAQENEELLLHKRWEKEIDVLMDLQKYESAVDYIERLKSQLNTSSQEKILEELDFKRLQIGVIQRESFFIKKAIDFYESTVNLPYKTGIAVYLADYFFELSMFKEAIDYLESTKKIYLTNALNEQVQFQKAVAYFSEKKFDNAKPYLKSLLQTKSVLYSTDAQYYLGFISFSEKNFDEALNHFQQIEKDLKYSKAVPFYLAYIYHDKGLETKAVEYGEDYLLNSDGLHQVEMMQLLASIYFNQDEYLKTSSLYEKLIAQGITLNPVQRFELGTSYYHLEKHVKAVEQLKPLSIGKDDIAIESMFVLGLAYLDLGDKSNARTSFQYCTSSTLSADKKEIATYLDGKLSFELGFEDQGFKTVSAFLDDYPSSKFIPEAKEILLKYYTKTNNFKAAISMLDKVDLSNPAIKSIIPRIYYGRGLELIYDVDYENAEQMLKNLKAYSSSNYYHFSIFWLGEISFRKNNFGAAANLFQQFLSTPSYSSGEANELNAYYNLGYCYYELEDYKKAVTYFEKVFLIDKDINDQKVREAVLRAADCYMMDKNFGKAKSLYERLVEYSGFGTDYAFFQASLIEGIKSPQSKIKILKEAIQKYSQSAYINLMYVELADTYMSEEEYEEAIPILKKLIDQIDKDDDLRPLSILKLGIAHFNLDNSDEAIKQYNQLIKEYPSAPQTSEALENAKLMFLENGKINDYQSFLESAGKSITEVEKDSLLYRYIQNAYALDPSPAVLNTLDGYISQFPNGLYVANVLALKADVHVKAKQYKQAAIAYEDIASKGVTSFQEKAIQNAAKLYYTELLDYTAAVRCYQKLSEISNNAVVRLDACRGVLKSYYQLSDFSASVSWVDKLFGLPALKMEDSSLAFLMLGYVAQTNKEFAKSNEYFKQVSSLVSNLLGAEASFQIAKNYFLNADYNEAEKKAIYTIENAGSQERWITKAYILLADIFLVQKDYFNAKATLKSIIEHCEIKDLKQEALEKLKAAEAEEKNTTKKK